MLGSVGVSFVNQKYWSLQDPRGKCSEYTNMPPKFGTGPYSKLQTLQSTVLWKMKKPKKSSASSSFLVFVTMTPY